MSKSARVRTSTEQETVAHLRSLVYGTHGRFFSIAFVKRTTGETRHMLCRVGVTKGVTGAGKPYEDKDYNLVTVYDVQKKAFRSVDLETIVDIKVNGQSLHISR